MSRVRCAIYTRKSSEEGLDQAFNSLDAQREACEAYIKSQQHEGWRLLEARYDDGGVSGGTLDRPALERLMEDIEAGRIDMVVVYKIDRLTRSLADFARLVERLEAAGASFVSVTQQFNTSTSMGRLTLNVLLSFAQFEREVTAERIRDKIAASKKKGMWMGGPIPFGYDRGEDGLVINSEEAQVVTRLFEAYLELGCVRKLKGFSESRDYRTKRHVFRSGRIVGGVPFSRGRLYHLLSNPLYIGRIRHRGETHDGLHKAIISQDLWDRVQARLAANRQARASRTNAANRAPLAGKVFDAEGAPLFSSHANKKGRRYRYYISKHHVVESGEQKAGWRLPAGELERAVSASLAEHREVQLALAATPDAAPSQDELLSWVTTVRIGRASLSVEATLPRACGGTPLQIEAPFTQRRRGVEQKLVLAARSSRAPDVPFIRRILRAMERVEKIRSGVSLAELAAAENTCPEYLSKNLDLAYLSPKVLQAIARGAQDPTLAVSHFASRRLPVIWAEQEPIFLDSVFP